MIFFLYALLIAVTGAAEQAHLIEASAAVLIVIVGLVAAAVLACMRRDAQ